MVEWHEIPLCIPRRENSFRVLEFAAEGDKLAIQFLRLRGAASPATSSNAEPAISPRRAMDGRSCVSPPQHVTDKRQSDHDFLVFAALLELGAVLPRIISSRTVAFARNPSGVTARRFETRWTAPPMRVQRPSG
jgi:hypothetical protein